MNILLLASHAVAEYDDIRMFTDMGHDVFCPGGYQDPRASGEGIRPSLPNAPYHPDLIAACEQQRRDGGDPGPWIDWAKANLHPKVVDWADVIIVHHFPEAWLAMQWKRIRHKRVIWRTCGQSDPRLEQVMAPFHREGMQIVRYSPAERRYFEPIGVYAGEDAIIRFGKYPDDYGPWTGEMPGVGNLTQDLIARGDACGYGFWSEATRGLPAMPAGKGSEALGGLGELSYQEMIDYLRRLRVYLYTGTRPASYTLGLIEAMLSGVPVVSIGARAWGASWGGADLFEAATTFDLDWPLRPIVWDSHDDPDKAREALRAYLDHPDKAATVSGHMRSRAIELFGIETVSAQWDGFLR